MRPILLCVLIFVSWDEGFAEPITEFERQQAAHNERQSKRLCAFMSLETMFPDQLTQSLASAAASGNVESIAVLIEKGAAPDAKGHRNCTVLFWALQNLQGFEALLKRGADPNFVFDDGGSVMNWAARLEDPAFLKAALNYGGDPNLRSEGGRTPLFYALVDHDPNLVLLLDSGADPNVRDSGGFTPAMAAATLNQFDVVYLLLDRGADPNIQDNWGGTLADIVAERRGRLLPDHELETWRKRVEKRLSVH